MIMDARLAIELLSTGLGGLILFILVGMRGAMEKMQAKQDELKEEMQSFDHRITFLEAHHEVKGSIHRRFSS